MYYRPETKQVFRTHSAIRKAFPSVSFPAVMTDAVITEKGLRLIVPTDPGHDPAMQFAEEGEPELREDGKWYQTWEVRDFTQAELDAQYQASIPRSVTKRQAKEALIRQGKYQQAVDALDAITDPTEKLIAQNYWQESKEFKRDNAVLNSLAETGLNMTQADLDDLFIYAATL